MLNRMASQGSLRPPTPNGGRLLRSSRSHLTVAGVALLILILLRQYQSGAYRVEFDSNPDESAHYVTALMVREFLASPDTHPMAFAENYYLHYPKVAFGVWPPLHDLSLGLWMTVTSNSRLSTILF